MITFRSRYGLKSFVDDPHAAIDGKGHGEIVNLADRRAEKSRCAQLELLSSLGPDRVTAEASKLANPQPTVAQPELPHLIMPAHHDVRAKDVFIRRLHGTLAAAADRGPVDFPELLRGVLRQSPDSVRSRGAMRACAGSARPDVESDKTD